MPGSQVPGGGQEAGEAAGDKSKDLPSSKSLVIKSEANRLDDFKSLTCLEGGG